MRESKLTVGGMVEATGISPPTIRLYGDLGLVPCEILSNGWRTFPPFAVDIAKRVHAERLARVGRKTA